MTNPSHSGAQPGAGPGGGRAATLRNRLGVDLGTTWTAASLNGEPLQLSDRRSAMPSVVAVDGGRLITGDAAERRLLSDPTSGVREMKRRLGDTAPFMLAGTPYGPEALMAALLRSVVDAATAQAGATPDEVVVTHPANWGEYKLDLLRECTRLAGVPDARLLSEPESAALHYVAQGRVQVGDVVAVYDFGGGTFDAAVVRCTESGPELIGSAEGLERLGGIDIDHIVMAHVDDVLDGQLSALDSDDPDVRRALTRLRADCTAAKEALSTDSEVSITVSTPQLSTVVRLTRSEFEDALRPRLADTLGALDRTIRSADLDPSDLAGVVLVGGSSRIPLVRESVAEFIGRPALMDADPKMVVCMGATEQNTSEAAVHAAASAPTPGGGGDAGTGPVPTEPSTVPPPTGPPSKPAAATGPGARLVASTDAQRERSGRPTAGGVAAGVAAVGAAAAIGAYAAKEFVFDDDVASLDAFDTDLALADEGLDDAIADSGVAVDGGEQPLAANMLASVFADLAGPSAPSGFAGPSGRSGPAPAQSNGGSAAPSSRPANPAPSTEQEIRPIPREGGASAPLSRDGSAPSMTPMTAELEAVKATLLERLTEWEPPAGADPAEVTELRERLAGLIERHQIVPGQSTDDAIESLRDEFALRVDDFTQDVKLDTLIEESESRSASEQALGDEVDSAVATLRGRLDAWEPPEGADADSIAELRADLAALLEGYTPIPGQTADGAIAELQQRFSNRVTDFAQDTRLDGITEDLTADLAAVPAADPAAPLADPDSRPCRRPCCSAGRRGRPRRRSSDDSR